jgi:hypothetical protein
MPGKKNSGGGGGGSASSAAPKHAVEAVKLQCTHCDAVAPGGTKVSDLHADCPKRSTDKKAPKPRFVVPREAPPALLARFIPMKAVAVTGTATVAAVPIAKKATTVAAVSDTLAKADLWSKAYKWDGSTWRAIREPSGSGHSERRAWNSVTEKEAQENWIGFVQNAPPCAESCFEYFLGQSKTYKGLVFFMKGDKGYLREYDMLAQTKVNVNFALYMRKGAWSINHAIGDAPAKEPA